VDPDLVIGEDGRSTEQQDHAFLVGRRDQELFLKSCGFESVKAIGLPFAYAMENQRGKVHREAGSLLVMPVGHSTDEEQSRNWGADSEYIDYLSSLVPSFDKLQVVLNGSDIRLGRAAPWERAGLVVLTGADYADGLSLSRLADLLGRFEFMSTNGVGSHVAYASASGCRVSIDGPASQPPNLPDFSIYQVRPELVPLTQEVGRRNQRELDRKGFFCHPLASEVHEDWGLAEIGFSNLLAPRETAIVVRKLSSFPFNSLGNAMKNAPLVFRASRRLRRACQNMLARIKHRGGA
jgi:hypothetical protein